MSDDGKLASGTTIGSLDVSGKTREQAASLLAEKYMDWNKATSIDLQYGEKTVTVDLSQFHLDSEKTVEFLKEGQRNTAILTIEPSQVEKQIETLLPEVNISDLDVNKLTSNLNEKASLFESGDYSFDLFTDYMATSQKNIEINNAVITMNTVPDGLSAAIEQNPTINISVDGTFSLLDYAKKHGINDEAVLSVLATGIYKTILPTNFPIVERNISSSLPGYAELGYEARVTPDENADLVFTNPNKAKYRLEMQLDGNQLKVALKGEKLVYQYKTSTNGKQTLEPKTIVQYSSLLSPGQKKIQTKGTEGQIIKVYRETYQDDQLVKSELISEDYYPPIYQVEVLGMANSQATDTISGTTGNQTGTALETKSNDSITSDIQAVSQDNQEPLNSNSSKLWGKPNEQSK